MDKSSRRVSTAQENRHATWRTQLHAVSSQLDNARSPVAADCAAIEAAVRRDTAVIAFGGHFSSGKSTLLNSLLGRPILPCDPLPETGAGCYLRAGDTDRAILVEFSPPRGRARSLNIPCTTAAIRSAVSVLTETGQDNEAVEAVESVRVSLSGVPIPKNVEWVDSPGIDDSSPMEDRARDVAHAADILVWVLSSRQLLSIREQDFLAEYVAARGSAGLVFLVNSFLLKDTAAEWESFTQSQLPRHVSKIRDQATRMTLDPSALPPILVTSGRALATASMDELGAASIRTFFEGLDGPSCPMVRRARALRAQEGLALAATNQSKAHQQRMAELAAVRSAAQAARRTSETNLAAFRTSVTKAIELWSSALAAGAEKVGDHVAQKVIVETANDASMWTGTLQKELLVEANSVTNALQKRIARACTDHQQRARSAGLTAEIVKLLPVAITVEPPKANTSLKEKGGAATGAIVGTMVAPVIGTVIGAGVGWFVGAFADVGADNKRRVLHTSTSIRSAAKAVWAGEMTDVRKKVLSLVLEACAVRPESIVVPDDPNTPDPVIEALFQLAAEGGHLANDLAVYVPQNGAAHRGNGTAGTPVGGPQINTPQATSTH